MTWVEFLHRWFCHSRKNLLELRRHNLIIFAYEVSRRYVAPWSLCKLCFCYSIGLWDEANSPFIRFSVVQFLCSVTEVEATVRLSKQNSVSKILLSNFILNFPWFCPFNRKWKRFEHLLWHRYLETHQMYQWQIGLLQVEMRCIEKDRIHRQGDLESGVFYSSILLW